jgi:hypothetical protein
MTRCAIVDDDVVGSADKIELSEKCLKASFIDLLVSCSVPSHGDHQIDGKFDWNHISHHVLVTPQGPQQTFASTGNQT